MISIKQIDTLISNIRLGVFDSDNYKIKCAVRGKDFASLELIDVSKNAYLKLSIARVKQKKKSATYYSCKFSQSDPLLQPQYYFLPENMYEDIHQFCSEWATGVCLNYEALVKEAFKI